MCLKMGKKRPVCPKRWLIFTKKGLFLSETALFTGKRDTFSRHQAGEMGGAGTAVGGL